jgi:hypothetical protein
MFARILFVLALMVAVASTAAAADFGETDPAAGGQTVPGAYVRMEYGVRVIRPIPWDPAWVANEETEIPGGVVYHGAAFYRAPRSVEGKAPHRSNPTRSNKPPVE